LAIRIAGGKFYISPFNARILRTRQCKIEFTAKHGKFTAVSVDYNDRTVSSEQIELPLLNKLSFNYNGLVEREKIESNLMSRDLHKITDWEQLLPPFLFTDTDRNVAASPGRTMNQLFGMGNYEPSAYVRE
jgi:lipoate-protein ligase A